MVRHEDEHSQKEIQLTPEAMADLFLKENFEFADQCRGENRDYMLWYSGMLENLSEGELPYAFADYFSPTDFWRTSGGNEIQTLPDEKRYYS